MSFGAALSLFTPRRSKKLSFFLEFVLKEYYNLFSLKMFSGRLCEGSCLEQFSVYVKTSK